MPPIHPTDLGVVERLIRALEGDERGALERLAGAELARPWRPNAGPQSAALECLADEVFYGGQAGGGKTDLLIGLALTLHHRSLLLRRTHVEAAKLVERFAELLGSRAGFNGREDVWRTGDGRVIDIRGCQHEDDKQKFKGAPHDLIGFDEISDFSETQYRFIIGWNRSADPSQRCRVVAAGNPPTRPEGLWVLRYWGPWLDPAHPDPARPGELRWFTTIEGADEEVDGPGPHRIGGESVMARSRSFIPATLADNPDLAETGYASVLAALPAGLRAAYKEGRFDAGLRDDDFQLIPTPWLRAAQERWRPDGGKAVAMTACGLDPAGGGRDSAELALRHGGWYAPLVSATGPDTADGSATAALVVRHRRDGCPVVVDAGGGYGGAVMLRFRDNAIPHLGFNGAAAGQGVALGSGLRFANKRAEAWWRFREALDPDQEDGSGIALPPDAELAADLAAPRWSVSARGILVEAKDEIRKRIGRSPGKGDAVVMAFSEGGRAVMRTGIAGGGTPKVRLGYAAMKGRRAR
jgi:hypothetical protein